MLSGKTTQPSDGSLQQPQREERIVDNSTNTDPAVPSARVTDSDAAGKDVSSKGLSGDGGNRHLDVRPPTLRPSADSLFLDLSLYTGNLSHDHACHPPTLRSPSPAGPPVEPAASRPRRSFRSMLWMAWLQSKGMLMVILSQFFGASMNVMTQMLEKDGSHGKAMHPFQVSNKLGTFLSRDKK